MKFSCKKCGQKYEAEKDHSGRRMQCQCGEVIEIPKEQSAALFHCPDCERLISKSAAFCPGCGCNTGIKLCASITSVRIDFWDMIRLIKCFFAAVIFILFILTVLVVIFVITMRYSGLLVPIR